MDTDTKNKQDDTQNASAVRDCPDSAGSLFWRSKGHRQFLKVTTERGHKDTGCYLWKVWEDEPNGGWTAYAPGGRRLGWFLSEVSAQVEVEKFYLANAEVSHGANN